MLSAAVLSLTLAQAPLQTMLVPTTLRAFPMEAILAADSKAPDHSFEPGWLIAGIAGGGVTAALFATRSTVTCAHSPTIDPGRRTGATIFWSIVPVALGTTLGVIAAKGASDAKTGVIVFDIVGPALGGLVWAIPSCS
jgi:hypothetical protein